MNAPRINDDERGITLDKPFAYTLAVGILVGGMWLGSEVVGTKRMVDELRASNAMQLEQKVQEKRDLEQRLRSLEDGRSTAAAELVALRRDLTEFRAESRHSLATIEQTLRQIYANGSSTR